MIRMDSIVNFYATQGQRLDANETLFLARELESVEAVLYQQVQTELRADRFIPVSNRDNPGAENITYQMSQQVGRAEIIGNNAQNLPTANAYIKEFSQPVKTIGSSCRWNTQELRAAIFAKKPLDTMKMAAARRAINEKHNDIAWNGDDEFGIKGLLNNAYIPTLACATGVGGYLFSQKTADEIIVDFQTMTTRVSTQSKGTYRADTVLLPREQYDIISTLPRATYSDMTVKEYLTKPGNSFGLTTIEPLETELDSVFVDGTADGAICYYKSPEVLEHRIPMPMQILPIEPRGLEFILPCEARDGGVVVRYPIAMLFFTGI